MPISKVALITRMSTQNAGNEALSIELINFFKRELPNAEIRAMDRYPRFFEHLKIAHLQAGGGSLIQAFDALADRLLARFSPSPQPNLAPLADERLVRLDQTAKELTGRLRQIKRAIALRQNLARLGLIGRDEVARTFDTCRWSDLLVWNPAGEFHPTGNPDQTFRLLLILRIAQRLGKRTAIINHSIEISDPRLRELVKHVYCNADYVGVRDAQSVQEALKLGVEAGRIHESPDLVFLASIPDAIKIAPADAIPEGAIGISINGLEAMRGQDEWDDFFARIKTLGREFVYLSNAMNHDLELAHQFAARHGGIVIERQPTYRELRGFYGRMGVLVSSRLHASILALCEGTPVISIEPSVFKLTAIFEQMNYSIPTDNLAHAGWWKRLSTHVEQALLDRGTLSNVGAKALALQVQRIHGAYERLFYLARPRVSEAI
ncbi:polysaccharide pyruvyl transferase family protein [Sphingomonas oleivorans]|nr:polysaccharide pyruvyl transferase family protein [Sphingomonas oleivorans]